MLRLVINCYNDCQTIRRCVESVPFADEVVAIDGRYIDFPGTENYSTDGTLEYLRSLPNSRVVLMKDAYEIDKRNAYLAYNEPGDWCLHLDADEEWTGGLELPDADMGIVRLRRSRPQHYMNRVRLFRDPGSLRYEGKHYWLRDGDRTFALLEKPGDNYTSALLPNNLIIHHEDDRLPERRMAKRKYYRILSKRENPIREFK